MILVIEEDDEVEFLSGEISESESDLESGFGGGVIMSCSYVVQLVALQVVGNVDRTCPMTSPIGQSLTNSPQDM